MRTIVIQAKKVPFANDPELRRDISQMGFRNSSINRWSGQSYSTPVTPFERKVLAGLRDQPIGSR